MKNLSKRMQVTVRCVVGMMFLMLFASSVFAETLRILEWEGYLPDEHQQKFIALVKEKYDIDLTLEMQSVGGNDDFFSALRNNTADIITPSHNVPRDERYQLIKHRLVLPLNLENIPNYKNVDPGLQYADYSTEGDDVYAVPVCRGPYGLAYNTAIVKETPESWDILWDPQYKDQYTLGKEQYEQNVYLTALAMGMTRDDMSNYKKLNTPEFQEKLTQLVVNAHSMWEGVDTAEGLQGLALALSWGDAPTALKDVGERWEMAEPKEGTTAWVDNLMIGYALEDKPQLRQIAEELLNYVLSDDYQMYLVQIGGNPIVTTITDQLTPEQIAQFHLNDPTHFQNYRVLWPTLSKADRKGLERLWKKALDMRK